MTKRVVVLDTGYDSYEYERKLLTQAGYSFEIFPGARHDRAGKLEFARDAVGIFMRWTDIDDEFLAALPNLKAIVRYGVGYDNIDFDAARRHEVRVANVQGYANHSVSDHAMAMIYACARALPLGQESLKSKFGAPPIREIFEFHDKTLGIIGLGRIGGKLCRKAQALFGEILASDPYIPDERFAELGAVKTDLNDLLARSDVISIHCNLTEETTNLFDKEKITLMPKRPILVNTASGPVVNEDGLKALITTFAIYESAKNGAWFL